MAWTEFVVGAKCLDADSTGKSRESRVCSDNGAGQGPWHRLSFVFVVVVVFLFLPFFQFIKIPGCQRAGLAEGEGERASR